MRRPKSMRGCVTRLLALTIGLLLQGMWGGWLYGQCDNEAAVIGKDATCSGCHNEIVHVSVCVYGKSNCEPAKTFVQCDACDEYIGSAGTCDPAPSQTSAAAILSGGRGAAYCESSSLRRLEEWVKSHPMVAKGRQPTLQVSR